MRSTTLRRFIGSRDGNLAVVFGVSLLPTMGLAGAAVDYSRASDARAQIQAALDGAVLAGISAPSAKRVETADKVFDSIFKAPAGVTAEPEFTPGGDGSLTGTYSADTPVQFMKAFGKTAIRVNARAVAAPLTTTKTTTTTTPAPTGGVCILVLDGTAEAALRVNGGVSSISASDCEIHIRSANAKAAWFDTGSPALDFKRLCVAGGAYRNGNVAVNNLQTNCTAATDPYASSRPNVTIGTCITKPNVNGGSMTFNPGTYCDGDFNFNGTTTIDFKPGLYILNGSKWNVGNSTWTCSTCTGGAGVTFYYANATSFIQFNSNVKMTLAAPTTGAYAGYLLFEAANLATSDVTVNAGPASSLTGLIHLPSRNMTFNSGTNMSSGNLTMVFNRLLWNSGTKWTFTPNTAKPITPPDAQPTTTTTTTTSTSTYLKQ